MKVWIAGLLVALAAATAHAATDPLAEARRLYNLGQYDNAARFARDAMKLPATTDGARLILGRIYLEQYRRSADPDHLMQAREALRAVNTQGLDRRERVELAIGLGEALFLEDRFGPAAELFERALDSSADLGPEAHERLLDWWASTVDRLALTGPRDTREAVYARIVTRMEKELAADPGSAPASYWLAAAARGAGNLERAWNAAHGRVGHRSSGQGPRRRFARRPRPADGPGHHPRPRRPPPAARHEADVRGDALRVGSAEGRVDAVAPGPSRGFESHPPNCLGVRRTMTLRRILEQSGPQPG